MSKFKFTTGPYRTISYGHIVTIESVKGETVCDVHFPDNPRSQANIKMIMAMDDILKALIEVIREPDFCDPTKFIQIVEKATGQTWEEISKG